MIKTSDKKKTTVFPGSPQNSNKAESVNHEQAPDDIYLTYDELSERIKFSKQSLYNMVHKGIFIKQVHYFKPTPKKLLFKWKAIKAWIERDPGDACTPVSEHEGNNIII